MSFNPGDSTENPDINPGAHAGPVQEGMAPGVPIESGLVDSPAKSGSNDFALASGLLVDATPTDPAWNGWDVVRIMIMFVVCFFVALLAMLAIVPGAGFKARAMRLAASPALAILAQMLAYVLLLGYMRQTALLERDPLELAGEDWAVFAGRSRHANCVCDSGEFSSVSQTDAF